MKKCLLNDSDEKEEQFWWHAQRDRLLELSKTQSPLYVYNLEILMQSAKQLRAIKSIDQISYALKANDHEDVLKTFYQLGLGFECVSVGEIARIFKLFPEIKPERILFTPNFAPKQEYEFALSKKCHVILDGVFPLERWAELFAKQNIFLRLDPGEGRGHHSHVKTAGEQSKFGISAHEIPRVLDLIKKYDVTVIGLHAHAGSGIADTTHWASVAEFLIKMASSFPEVKVLDLGGGLAVSLNLEKLDESLRVMKNSHPEYEFWLEPGRYLVADAGVLLAHVTQLKEKGDVSFVGVDAGMNSLIRPMLYGAYHPIVNLTRLDEKATMIAHVVGPICESGDTLGYNRRLPETHEGDVMLIANAGAYGHVMSSHYNRRDPAGECFLNQCKTSL